MTTNGLSAGPSDYDRVWHAQHSDTEQAPQR